MADSRTWILTGSPDNFAATAQRDFSLIGLKEGRRNFALQIAPGDRIVFYLTGVKAFGGSVRVTGELFEDRAPVWPGKPGKRDAYPWRFRTEPELILEEARWIPAEELRRELEHVRKWPDDGWTLAFQGQIRAVSDADAETLVQALREAAGRAAAVR